MSAQQPSNSNSGNNNNRGRNNSNRGRLRGHSQRGYANLPPHLAPRHPPPAPPPPPPTLPLANQRSAFSAFISADDRPHRPIVVPGYRSPPRTCLAAVRPAIPAPVAARSEGTGFYPTRNLTQPPTRPPGSSLPQWHFDMCHTLRWDPYSVAPTQAYHYMWTTRPEYHKSSNERLSIPVTIPGASENRPANTGDQHQQDPEPEPLDETEEEADAREREYFESYFKERSK